jgi:Methane oxygenase PmoA
MVMSLNNGSAFQDNAAVTVRWDDVELFRYIYLPTDAQLESPRPYFHPVRTLARDVVSLYRPHDHVWHKGIVWSLPNVGPENFWGGATYRRGDGYVQLPNNGAMRHESFDLAVVKDDVARLEERLTWVTQPWVTQPWVTGGGVTEHGETLIAEQRRIAVAAWPDQAAWVLAFETTMRNVSEKPISFGSPTTQGRENAGYGGLFWRGPRSFTSGRVVTPGRSDGGDEVMGSRGPWLAFAGRHDEHGRWSTLLFRDSPENFSYPSQWFVRSTPFACVCPAPFFAAEYQLGAGASLTLRYDIVVCDGALSSAGCARLADRAAAHDLLSGSI